MPINRCRPGFGSSCSLCCGSHNYREREAGIENIFMSRGLDPDHDNALHPEEYSEKKLIDDGMQCPHVGISPDEPEIICCLVYNSEIENKNTASFFKGTCSTFQCPAWYELTDDEVLFAAELMKDWYYYSLLINSINVLKDIAASYAAPSDMPGDMLEILKLELDDMILSMDIM